MSDKFKDYNNKGFNLWHKAPRNKAYKDILSEADDIISKLILESQYNDKPPIFKIVFTSFVCTVIFLTAVFVVIKY